MTQASKPTIAAAAIQPSWRLSISNAQRVRTTVSAAATLSVVFAAGLAGCADFQLPELPVAPAPIATATIGPEGGSIELPLNNGLGQASITFPPGALAAPTEITIAPGIHNAPLPERAFPVGPYVRLEPKGLALSKAAQLTLPVYAELRGAFGQDAKFVKVWLKGPEKWELYEQVNAGDGFVSIDTLRLDVAGAGVKMPTPDASQHPCLLAGKCIAGTTASESAQATDCAASFCVAEMQSTSRVPLIPRLIPGDGYVSWLDLADGQDTSQVDLCAHKVGLDGTIELDAWPALQVGLDEVWDTLRARGATDSSGSLTVAQLGGLAHFKGQTDFVPGEDPTVALVDLRDGRAAHFTDDAGRLAVALRDEAGGWHPRRNLTGLPLVDGSIVAAAGREGEVAIASGTTLVFADASETTLSIRPGKVALSERAVAVAATEDGRTAVLTSDGWVSIVEAGGTTAEPVMDEGHALVSDGRHFWLALNNRPALAHIDASFGYVVSVVPLATEAVEVEALDGYVPRALASPSVGAVMVLTRDARFRRVSLGTTP